MASEAAENDDAGPEDGGWLSATASAAPVFKMSDRYLSFCVDLGQIAEPTRFWNPDGSGETIGERPSFDFASARLRNLCRALAPAYLRVGGTEADRVFYALDPAGQPLQHPPLVPPPHHGSVLTASHLRGLGDFATDVGLNISFALNAGWGPRGGSLVPRHGSASPGSLVRKDGSASAWRCVQARALMRFAAAEGIPIRVWELGNEPNVRPIAMLPITDPLSLMPYHWPPITSHYEPHPFPPHPAL
jgi:hypothetical protein